MFECYAEAVKLVIEYDPFAERRQAASAAAALDTLGIPAHLREVRPSAFGNLAVVVTPVKFEPVPPAEEQSK